MPGTPPVCESCASLAERKASARKDPVVGGGGHYARPQIKRVAAGPFPSTAVIMAAVARGGRRGGAVLHYISALVPRYRRVSGHLREGTRGAVGSGTGVCLDFDYPARRNLPGILSGEKEARSPDHGGAREQLCEHERPTSGDGAIVCLFFFCVSTIREVGNDLILISDGMDRGRRCAVKCLHRCVWGPSI